MLTKLVAYLSFLHIKLLQKLLRLRHVSLAIGHKVLGERNKLYQ